MHQYAKGVESINNMNEIINTIKKLKDNELNMLINKIQLIKMLRNTRIDINDDLKLIHIKCEIPDGLGDHFQPDNFTLKCVTKWSLYDKYLIVAYGSMRAWISHGDRGTKDDPSAKIVDFCMIDESYDHIGNNDSDSENDFSDEFYDSDDMNCETVKETKICKSYSITIKNTTKYILECFGRVNDDKLYEYILKDIDKNKKSKTMKTTRPTTSKKNENNANASNENKKSKTMKTTSKKNEDNDEDNTNASNEKKMQWCKK
jgi:hypothetical protein